MIVITLTDCPLSLRGELTKWLLEINTGVYVGNVSSRVRDQIWKKVQEQAPKGRSTMVFSCVTNEQKLDFRTHQSDWEPIDYDGLKLMLRPSDKRTSQLNTNLSEGFSKAANNYRARQMNKNKRKSQNNWDDYVAIDIETTGLSPDQDEIIEIGAIKVRKNKMDEKFQRLIRIAGKVPNTVKNLTGITEEMLQHEGEMLEQTLLDFLAFIGDLPVIVHNADFEYSFLQLACKKHNLPLFSNQFEDTLYIAKSNLTEVTDYKLETLVKYFNIPVTRLHRSLDDCFATVQLYQKLNEIRQNDS